MPFLTPHSFVVLADRPVCSLLDAVPSEAHILGQDGGTSVEADGHVFWSFNDTWVLKPDDVQMLIPNNIASTDDHDASDCVSLTSKMGSAHAEPALLRDPGENGVLPSGTVAVQAGFVHFLYASSVPDASTDIGYRIRGFGLGRFDTATGVGERLLGGQLIWNDSSFPGGHLDEALAVVDDGYVYVLLRLTLAGLQAGTLLARTPAGELEAANFAYWNGSSWSSDAPDVSTAEAASKALLWVQPIGMNAPSIAYNEFLGKWVAVYSSGFAHLVEVRVADNVTGRWAVEPPSLAVDCLDFLPQPQHSYICYMAQQHSIYERDGGRTIYVTWNNADAYQVYLHELRLGAPISQWTDKDGHVGYKVGGKAAPGYDGIAFYASDIPVPGFAAIHRWQDGTTGASRFAAQSPGDSYSDGGIAFYAPLNESAAKATNAAYAPVYRWSKDGVDRYSPLNLSPAGYVAVEFAFFGACPDSDKDGLNDCKESFLGVKSDLADTDGDGLNDGYEWKTGGCDPVLYTDDHDGMATLEEALGVTNPCVWDSGYWGCANAPVRDLKCDQDTDSDRCQDAWELGPDPRFGGQRDPEDPWDYFNPTGDGRNRTDDILAVVGHYFVDAGDPGYSSAYDRGGLSGSNFWDLAPPDGRIRLDDILAAMRSYHQDCP